MSPFDSNHPARASQIWQILVGLAYNRQTITFGGLAEIMGFQGAGIFANILGHIMFYCLQHGLPVLTVLVVNQETGLPGDGIILSPEANGDPNVERERVFNRPWYRFRPPTQDELAQAWQNRPQ